MSKTTGKTSKAKTSKTKPAAGKKQPDYGNYRALVIVESPAKTKTLKNFLGSDYRVEASMGHVRDLPQKEFAVDIENGFEPKYQLLPTRKEVISRLREAAQSAETVYLATDPDREGEAIAWHLQHALKLQNPARIEFNEITESAVQRAIANPRTIDMNRVNAQQARRILDRLVGYQVSPLLWRKMSLKTLSAGRVQSVAVRLIVEREREIRAFVPEEYWRIFATLTPLDQEFPFDAELKMKGKEKVELKNEAQAQAVLDDLQGAAYVVESVEKKQRRRQPAPPFITSTLQQEASRKLGYSAKRTMQVAQDLYEGVNLGAEGHVGLITYMRTDSTRVSDEAQKNARDYVQAQYGQNYLPEKPRQFKAKGKAQDAHEAVRPTDVRRTPASVAQYLSLEQLKLYELIWKRFLASQMADAQLEVTTVNIRAKEYLFRASGTVILFDGFMKLYTEGKDSTEKEEDEMPPLPPLTQDQLLRLIKLDAKQSFTQPPPRYTEATLVKALEQNGVGRPSTYASILSTIRDRGYVELESRAFKPTALGETVVDYLVEKFPDIFEVKFTAHMEQELDEVESGEMQWVAVLNEFYAPFKIRLDTAMADPQRVKIPDEQTNRTCPNCGKPMVLKSGRYGKFLACTGYPECKTTMPAGSTGIICPQCNEGEIIERKSKKGRTFYTCSRPQAECGFISWNKPTGEMCPECGKPLVETKRTNSKRWIGCSNKECAYKTDEVLEQDMPGELAEAG